MIPTSSPIANHLLAESMRRDTLPHLTSECVAPAAHPRPGLFSSPWARRCAAAECRQLCRRGKDHGAGEPGGARGGGHQLSSPRKRGSIFQRPQCGASWVPATGSPRRGRRGGPLAGTTGGDRASTLSYAGRIDRQLSMTRLTAATFGIDPPAANPTPAGGVARLMPSSGSVRTSKGACCCLGDSKGFGCC